MEAKKCALVSQPTKVLVASCFQCVAGEWDAPGQNCSEHRNELELRSSGLLGRLFHSNLSLFGHLEDWLDDLG